MIPRPKTLADYVGQERAKKLIQAELAGGRMPRHILLYGLQGLGKTSLANVIANESGLTFHGWQASKQMAARTLTADLFALSIEGYAKDGTPSKTAVRHLVFIDELHNAPFETLYPVMEDGILNPDPNGKPSWLPQVCIVGATTDPNLLSGPLRDRFPVRLRLDPYDVGEIAAMVLCKFPRLKDSQAGEIAKRSRGNARDAVNYAESVLLHGLQYFELMEIDEQGLTKLDRQVLDVLRLAGRPLSLHTIAAMVQENATTIRDVVEPALIAVGLMEITPKGRQAVGSANGQHSRGLPVFYAR